MKKTNPLKKYVVWEHLEHALENTTYSMRLKWLEEADKFVRAASKAKVLPSKK